MADNNETPREEENHGANGNGSNGSNGSNGNNGSNGAGMNGAIGAVRTADIIGEMQTAYLDYAMSVIVARALPDVRDGLKPVHRRILYAMWNDLSLTYDKPHKKSARIVGEVLGKYHPHGDAAVYDAMVRMAQSFSLRYPLIDGQGNFGSIDGDNAAAMRYTEARLARLANLMLDDLDKETVEWHPNFDNTLREPDILPAALPNLLVNGSAGIAVGMATNIPPHNLGEVVDALTFLIDHFDHVDDITVEQLMRFIKGPDFPTGGIVYRFREGGKDEEDIDAVAQGYSMGKSRLIVQAKAHFEEISRGRTRIIVTELPYQTNKTALIERIADLVRDSVIEGISDLRDESDRTGMRIVIELARTVEPKDVLAKLFKHTPLQQTFGMQLLALVDGQPRLLNLKRILQLFVHHRQEIIRRRSEFDLKRARERAHIVEGLLRALDILDEVIHTIRHSQTVDTARKNLMSNFGFTEIQAQAILDMQLRRLAALERKKLQEEYDELKKRIAYLEDLLAHPQKVLGVIKEELLAIREQYADPRRTQIVDRTRGALTTHDLLPDQMVWVGVGQRGVLHRQLVTKASAAALRQAARDSQVAFLTANTRELLYVFSKDGRCSRFGIHEIPEDSAGKTVSDVTGFTGRDEITAALTLPRDRSSDETGYLFFCTEQGVVKRVATTDVQANTGSEFPIMNVEKGDRLLAAFATQGSQEVILVTASGQSIRFNEEEVRSMGLPAAGVGGIKLGKKDQVVFAGLVDSDGELLTLTADGYAKRTALSEYSSQGRNGSGIVTHKITERTGPVTAAIVLPSHADNHWLAFVTQKGTARPALAVEMPAMGRSVQGKQVMSVTAKDTVTAIWLAGSGGERPSPGAADEDAPPNAGSRSKKLPVGPETTQPRLVEAATVAANPAGKPAPPPASAAPKTDKPASPVAAPVTSAAQKTSADKPPADAPAKGAPAAGSSPVKAAPNAAGQSAAAGAAASSAKTFKASAAPAGSPQKPARLEAAAPAAAARPAAPDQLTAAQAGTASPVAAKPAPGKSDAAGKAGPSGGAATKADAAPAAPSQPTRSGAKAPTAPEPLAFEFIDDVPAKQGTAAGKAGPANARPTQEAKPGKTGKLSAVISVPKAQAKAAKKKK